MVRNVEARPPRAVDAAIRGVVMLGLALILASAAVARAQAPDPDARALEISAAATTRDRAQLRVLAAQVERLPSEERARLRAHLASAYLGLGDTAEAHRWAPGPYDSHPAPTQRFAFAAAVDDSGRLPEEGAFAWDLFADREALERDMTDEVRRRLAAMSAIEILADGPAPAGALSTP